MRVPLSGWFLLFALSGILVGLKLLFESSGLHGPSWWFVTFPFWVPIAVWGMCWMLERVIDFLGRVR